MMNLVLRGFYKNPLVLRYTEIPVRAAPVERYLKATSTNPPRRGVLGCRVSGLGFSIGAFITIIGFHLKGIKRVSVRVLQGICIGQGPE